MLLTGCTVVEAIIKPRTIPFLANATVEIARKICRANQTRPNLTRPNLTRKDD
jgi:hypothetical protein